MTRERYEVFLESEKRIRQILHQYRNSFLIIRECYSIYSRKSEKNKNPLPKLFLGVVPVSARIVLLITREHSFFYD
jgi:hypothetical protein